MLQESVNYKLPFVSEVFDTAVDLEEMISVYSQAAEYFNLSCQHRTLHEASTRQNGTRVADLYERLAELKSNVFDIEAHDAVTNAAIDFYVRAINVLNQSSVLEAEELVWWEKSIEYAVHACNPSSDSVYAARHWLCAFLLTKEVAKGYVDSESMAVVLAKGLIALHACAAESTQERAQIVYEACIAEVSALVSTIPGYYSPPDRQYKLALVAHIVQSESTLVDSEPFNVPSEVQNVVNLAMGNGYRTALLDEHVHALLLKAQCLYSLETLTDLEKDRESWEEAYSATIDLCQACTLCSVELPNDRNSPRLLSYLASRKAIARRLVAKAESVLPEPVPHVDLNAPAADTDTEWPESTNTNTVDNRRALVAVEQYTWASEQAELHAATEAYGRQCKLKYLSNELKHAVDYAQRLSMNQTDESSRFYFDHYEAQALGTIEQLRKEH
eukprot:gene24247-27429_t